MSTQIVRGTSAAPTTRAIAAMLTTRIVWTLILNVPTDLLLLRVGAQSEGYVGVLELLGSVIGAGIETKGV